MARLDLPKFLINIRPLGALFWAPRKEEMEGSLREEKLPKEREKFAEERGRKGFVGKVRPPLKKESNNIKTAR